MTVGIFEESGQCVAVGWATPLRLTDSKNLTSFDGLNLSYVVDSRSEGKGYGIAAACLAITQAQTLWGAKLKNVFLNIQTREENVRSNRLIEALQGNRCEEACFTVNLRSGRTISYVGSRTPWLEAVALAADRNHAREAALAENASQEQACLEPTQLA